MRVTGRILLAPAPGRNIGRLPAAQGAGRRRIVPGDTRRPQVRTVLRRSDSEESALRPFV